MTLMDSMKVGDMVVVDERNWDGRHSFVGKIASISKGQIPTVYVQIGPDKYKQTNLSNCWDAQPGDIKQYFKAMLGG